MDKFIEWIVSEDAPYWLMFPLMMACFTALITLVMGIAFLLSIGLWPVVIIIWLITPSYVIYREYSKYNGGNK